MSTFPALVIPNVTLSDQSFAVVISTPEDQEFFNGDLLIYTMGIGFPLIAAGARTFQAVIFQDVSLASDGNIIVDVTGNESSLWTGQQAIFTYDGGLPTVQLSLPLEGNVGQINTIKYSAPLEGNTGQINTAIHSGLEGNSQVVVPSFLGLEGNALVVDSNQIGLEGNALVIGGEILSGLEGNSGTVSFSSQKGLQGNARVAVTVEKGLEGNAFVVDGIALGLEGNANVLSFVAMSLEGNATVYVTQTKGLQGNANVGVTKLSIGLEGNATVQEFVQLGLEGNAQVVSIGQTVIPPNTFGGYTLFDLDADDPVFYIYASNQGNIS